MIIIVEDDDISGRLLTKMLEGYFPEKKYIWIRTIHEAINYLEKAASSPADLLLLDVYLEDGNAWDILESVKKGRINFKGQVFLLPGISPDSEELKMIDRYQPVAVMIKPLSVENLKSIIGCAG